MWGLAFDSDRAVFYGGMEQLSNIRIVAMNPNTGSVTPLPNKVGAYTTDLAFNPSDHQIYGVASVGGGPKLMRIDRDTGIGTVVGPTTAVNGLDWDPATAHLIGISNASGLWSIDHTTGRDTLITSSAQPHRVGGTRGDPGRRRPRWSRSIRSALPTRRRYA